jgi:hypothetical protein
MITSARNTAQRGAGCKRCRIIRMFIIATMFIVILGLVGGDNLRFLSMVTAEGIAAAIWIAGGLLFLIKFSFWLLDKSKDNANGPEQA